MSNITLTTVVLICFIAFTLDAGGRVSNAQEWSVPAAGNAFRTAPDPNHRAISRDGTLAWSDPQEVFSIYFHVDRPARLTLALEARAREGRSKINVTVENETFATTIDGDEFAPHAAGTFEIDRSGYVQVGLQGTVRAGAASAELRSLIVRSETEGLSLTCVASDEGNMFYWGRRGPSVHLSYVVPRDIDLQYAYSEITVAAGDDPVGSYFMANGFAEGYFGIQVNAPRERRVLFSVWSPFRTDNPREIPEDQRVELLARGPEVKTGEFGNEGSGGQSFLVYPWQAGRTYRFLTQVTPDNNGSTTYTSWFGDKQEDEWRLIATFRRPKTETHLRRFHSFLENFNPLTGHLSRRGQHKNIWVRDTAGNWHECLTAQFSVDATARGGHRLDFVGGADGAAFYLRSGGFFGETGVPGSSFTRSSTANDRPRIDVDQLPHK